MCTCFVSLGWSTFKNMQRTKGNHIHWWYMNYKYRLILRVAMNIYFVRQYLKNIIIIKDENIDDVFSWICQEILLNILI